MASSELKPWSKLEPLEKREAIAVRLGWRHTPYQPYRWWQQDWSPEANTHTELPDWPTNDGLAITEVNRAIQMVPSIKYIGIGWFSNGRRFVEVYNGSMHIFDAELLLADGLCAAAYELLPVP